ncbi:hypothetical protein CCR94_22945 [Rhodoblastus sphagnicola]|uniref:Uncharacterized protein n=1 Tax=Rhodoblastus sphagnicola TaxID=333368 RepID=A0A2S6MVU3_9HYPH|nr:hypothetical protein [Rhodoblastus sphagnicola]PPQ26481.1 hypothetical protein CCR94_22945 [Rhodoblastus sphagnicola]
MRVLAVLAEAAPQLPSPLAGEGGAIGRLETPVLRRAMAPDEGAPPRDEPLIRLAAAAASHLLPQGEKADRGQGLFCP